MESGELAGFVETLRARYAERAQAMDIGAAQAPRRRRALAKAGRRLFLLAGAAGRRGYGGPCGGGAARPAPASCRGDRLLERPAASGSACACRFAHYSVAGHPRRHRADAQGLHQVAPRLTVRRRSRQLFSAQCVTQHTAFEHTMRRAEVGPHDETGGVLPRGVLQGDQQPAIGVDAAGAFAVQHVELAPVAAEGKQETGVLMRPAPSGYLRICAATQSSPMMSCTSISTSRRRQHGAAARPAPSTRAHRVPVGTAVSRTCDAVALSRYELPEPGVPDGVGDEVHAAAWSVGLTTE